MQRLTELALQQARRGVFTRTELGMWVGGSQDRQNGLLRRALRAGEIVRMHRGLYALAGRYLDRPLDPLVMAQRLHGPSYLSLETALSRHGWIPEHVTEVTSCTADRSRAFETPLGRFSYTRVPQHTLHVEVQRVEHVDGSSYLLATPWKALADYVYAYRRDWSSPRPVVNSLRVAEHHLDALEDATIERLLANYSSRRVRRFLDGLRRSLCR
jgi:hypothetical protein